jgi:hypothetical protein
MKPRFKVGQQFTKRSGIKGNVWTIVDILTTRNSAREVVKIRYVAKSRNPFLVDDSDVVETTIAMGLIEDPK